MNSNVLLNQAEIDAMLHNQDCDLPVQGDGYDTELGDGDDLEISDTELVCEVEVALLKTHIEQKHSAALPQGYEKLQPRTTSHPLVQHPTNQQYLQQRVVTMYRNSFQRRMFGKAVPAFQCRSDEFQIVSDELDHGQRGFLGMSIFASEKEALLAGLEEVDAELKLFQRVHGEILHRLKQLESNQGE